MPGRTPAEAFDAFVDPLQEALGCLASAKITPAQGCRKPGGDRSWSINFPRGLTLKDGWHFEAEMMYRIIEDRRPGADPWRVSTRAYRYRISNCDIDVVRMHWHPGGQSPFKAPHFHIPNLPGGSMGEKGHLPVSRVTFEDAVEWVIVLSGQSARDDWRAVLDRTRDTHLEHRSWSDTPPLLPESEVGPGR